MLSTNPLILTIAASRFEQSRFLLARHALPAYVKLVLYHCRTPKYFDMICYAPTAEFVLKNALSHRYGMWEKER
jgi:hypothetical protein